MRVREAALSGGQVEHSVDGQGYIMARGVPSGLQGGQQPPCTPWGTPLPIGNYRLASLKMILDSV